MPLSRRHFLATSTAAITLLPYATHADGHSSDVFETSAGNITIHPLAHASFVMETPNGTIYVDPVGGADTYADMPDPDLILITHAHGDHFDVPTLEALNTDNAAIYTNPAVFAALPAALQAKATEFANGDSGAWGDMGLDVIPAYNTTEGRTNFHPQGRDNGYVLTFADFRVYISGDTEDVPEMRALENIDLAFVCMNLPFTMDVKAAASAVMEFAPTYVYPYHYRGRDNGTQDPVEFAALLSGEITAKMGPWYG